MMVDDAHATGVLGEGGRGTVDHFGLHGRVDIQVGTLSAGHRRARRLHRRASQLIRWLVNRGRPYLFSTSAPPAVVAACTTALDILGDEPDRLDRLWSNTRAFKDELHMLGFDTGDSQTPITPVMVGEEATAQELSKGLWDEGVFAPAIVYPTVPRGGLGCGRSSRPITDHEDPSRQSMRSAGSATGSGCSRFAVRSGGSGGMTIDAERLEARARLGSVGVWSFALDELPAGGERRRWPRSRHLGYPSLWIPGGAVQQGDHRSREPVARRERAAHHRDRDREHGLATPSPSRTPPDFSPTIIPGGSCSASARAFPTDRGPRLSIRTAVVGHAGVPRCDGRRSLEWTEPARPAPRLLAALGPRMLELAAERTAGAHTYFVPVETPAPPGARSVPNLLLAVEQTVVLESDPSAARHLARGFAADYLELLNYANNLAGSASPMRTSPGAGATG